MAVGSRLGSYAIERELGRGGMGAVYVGTHELLKRTAAIKILLPQYSKDQAIVQRFFNEARAATAIKHPSIVEIFDFGFAEDGAAYIVMELCDGESLATRMRRQRVVPVATALAVTRQIANALAAAHKAGIIHRDLKPDNVFLVRDSEVLGGERIKLLDFGIAKLVSDTSTGPSQTTTGTIIGTPHYMSPEQCRGAGAIDHRTDLYSLGCILYEMVCGRVPFVGEGAGDVIGAHLLTPVPSPRLLAPALPEDVDALIQKLLAKKPDERPPTAEHVVAMIQRLPATQLSAAASDSGWAVTAQGTDPNGDPSGLALGETVAPLAVGTSPTVEAKPRSKELPIEESSSAETAARPKRSTARMPAALLPRRRRASVIPPILLAVAAIGLGVLAYFVRAPEVPAFVLLDGGNTSDGGNPGIETRLEFRAPATPEDPPSVVVSIANGPSLPLDKFMLRDTSATNPPIVTATSLRKFAEGKERVAIAIVVDGSEAWMGNDDYETDEPARLRGFLKPLASAIDQVKLVEQMPRGSLAALITYANGTDVRLPMGPIGRLTGAVLGTQKDYQKRYGKDLVAGIRQACNELVKAETSIKVLVVIGDGNDVNNEAAKGQLANLKKEAGRQDIERYAFVLKDKLSQDGTVIGTLIPNYATLTTPESLAAALENVLLRVTDRYDLTFPGRDLVWDGKRHDLTIRIDKAELDPIEVAMPVWRPPSTAWERWQSRLCIAGAVVLLALAGLLLVRRARASGIPT